MLAIRVRGNCEFNFDLPASFKKPVFAILEVIGDAVYKEEAWACYTTFELLPMFAKQSLWYSCWWNNLLQA